MVAQIRQRRFARALLAGSVAGLALFVVTGLMRQAADGAFNPAGFWVLSGAALVFATTLYQVSKRASR